MSVLASVIVPTRDRPELLVRGLRSLLAQEDGDWEALVVDDGDGSGIAAAAALRDPRIRTLENPGRGQVDARNTAIALARGGLVCWLDDDDWWDDPGHVGLLRAAAAAGEAILFRSGWLVADDGSREPFDWGATAESLRSDNTVLTSSIAYPRAAHRRIGLLDRELAGYADWDVLLRLVDAGLPLRRLGGPGVCYAVHAGGGSAAYDAPERRARFERLCAKHGLSAVIASHATLNASR